MKLFNGTTTRIHIWYGNDLKCKLKKDLCRLKQAPCAWYDMLTKYLQKTSFKQSITDVLCLRKSILK